MPCVASPKHLLIRNRPGGAARKTEIAGQATRAQKSGIYVSVKVGAAQEKENDPGLLNTRKGFARRSQIAQRGKASWKFVGGGKSPSGTSQRFFAAAVFEFHRSLRSCGSSRIATQSRSAFVEHGSEVPRSRRANPRCRIHGLSRQRNRRSLRKPADRDRARI